MDEFLKPIEWAKKAKRIVVKVGTSVLTDPRQGRVTEHGIQTVASQVAALWKEKRQVVVVTSGAIGVGMGVMNMKKRPAELPKLQAAAAIGQGRLMQWYTARFEQEDIHTAQVLLTRGDLEDRKRSLNAQATLLMLLNRGVVPIVNENDTVSVEEIRYGDNDVLSAHVATLIGADLLVILSDVDHLVGPLDPLRVITEVTPELENFSLGSSKEMSTGGMKTKLEAAKEVMKSGIPMVLMDGRGKNNLVEMVFKGEDRGTWFIPKRISRIKGKRSWLFIGKPKGTVGVDAGAREALTNRGSSLLASGVRGVTGVFRQGDLVSVIEFGKDQEFARGLVSYSDEDLRRIQGVRSQVIPEILGAFRRGREVIHRDYLVILRR